MREPYTDEEDDDFGIDYSTDYEDELSFMEAIDYVLTHDDQPIISGRLLAR